MNMMKIKYFVISIITATCVTACNTASKNTRHQNAITTDENSVTSNTLIIMYDSAIGIDPLLKATEKYKASIIYRYNNINGIAIKIPTGKDIEDAIKYFKSVEGVITVNRDRIVRLMH